MAGFDLGLVGCSGCDCRPGLGFGLIAAPSMKE
jgi:hypothetical protein